LAAGGAAITTNGGTSGGTINDVLTLPAGSSITYTVNGVVAPTASGTLTNAATATVAATDTDTNTANNTSTVINQVVPVVDVSVTKTDNRLAAAPGGVLTYTIVVKNSGQTALSNVSLTDAFSPTLFSSETWTSTASAGAGGNTASGTGNINETTLVLAPGATITYTVQATVAPGLAVGTPIVNTAAVATASGVADNDLSNNVATDTDAVAPPFFNQYAVGADAGAQGHVKVFTADGTERMSFFAFPGFNGGVRVATGDVNRDGVNDIVVGAGPSGANGHVKVFDGVDGHLIASFFAFEGFLGGVYVAVGDVNHDGAGDLIIGSGVGVGHVKVFSMTTTGAPAELYSFFAYPGYLGGITVASGDVNGDGFDDIVTGTTNNASHMKVISVASGAPVELFSQFVLPPSPNGISVAAGNVRGDGRAEFLAAPLSAGIGGPVQAFSIDGTSPLLSFTPNFPGAASGLRLAVADADGDGDNDILVAAGPGVPSLVDAYDATTLSIVREVVAFEGFLGGVFVG
jgi:uncharacterized repeat protein (TIGR01451 family)